MINQRSVSRHSKVPILLTPLFLCRNLKCLFFSCDKYWDIEKVTEPKANVYRELAYRVNETLGFMTCAGLTFDHPIMTATDF
ncbi:Phospho-2-dehydro-3-deoxyheptonate aldolase 2, chloroplastic [Trifolium repens]|nr:Phospho-2-dehydro-3-deoxyheptonate aldolase 2, chloroplastic [Trifolium repens]